MITNKENQSQGQRETFELWLVMKTIYMKFLQKIKKFLGLSKKEDQHHESELNLAQKRQAYYYHYAQKFIPPNFTEQQKKLNRKRLLLRKGCRPFIIDGIEIIALNRKNAIRKFMNIKKAQHA